MRRIFKLVFLFVGVVIGAGFATGSEIVLYFKNSGYISVVISGIIMGLLSIAFCYFGKLQSKYKIMKNLTKIVVFLSSIITYCIMISGTSELIYNQFGIKYFGIITGFVVALRYTNHKDFKFDYRSFDCAYNVGNFDNRRGGVVQRFRFFILTEICRYEYAFGWILYERRGM